MRKILLSLLTVSAVAVVAVVATGAYFNDVETSQDNTFTAGELDLKVDSECQYYQNNVDVGCGPNGTWSEGDLTNEKFFFFDDVKPGDRGENTISLHVYDNDAWGKLVISAVQDLENTCEEPEEDVEGALCTTPDGELRENLSFWVWVDQGNVDGFQCSTAGSGTPGVAKCALDPLEGDNVWQDTNEPLIITPGDIDALGETWNIWEGLQAAWVFNGSQNTDGIVQDGRMVGSITYYFGVGWDLPSSVGNEVQSDSFSGDMTINVTQYRNNPSKLF